MWSHIQGQAYHGITGVSQYFHQQTMLDERLSKSWKDNAPRQPSRGRRIIWIFPTQNKSENSGWQNESLDERNRQNIMKRVKYWRSKKCSWVAPKEKQLWKLIHVWNKLVKLQQFTAIDSLYRLAKEKLKLLFWHKKRSAVGSLSVSWRHSDYSVRISWRYHALRSTWSAMLS